MPSSSTGRPIRAQPTACDRWKSPTDSASESPSARCAISATVQTPMPGTADSRRAASSGAMPTASSSRDAQRIARQIVRERLGSTPARCHSHDGTCRQASRRRRHAHAVGRRPGRGLAVAQDQAAERVAGLAAGDLLLEHGGDERLDDAAGTGDPQARVAAGGVGEQRVARLEVLGEVASAEQVGQAGQQLLRARPPGLGADLVQPPLHEPAGDGAGLEQAGAPDGAVLGDAVRRVTAAAAQRRQSAPDVHRHLRAPGGRGDGHRDSLPRLRPSRA